MIPLGSDGAEGIEALLRTDRMAAMFPLANLRNHGIGGGHPNATRFWGDAAPPRRALLGLTNRGMALPFATDPEDAAAMLRGCPILGFAGAAATVRPLMSALGIAGVAARLDADEPQFGLDLTAMIVPEGEGSLAPLGSDPDRALRWRMAYDEELHVGADTQAGARAEIDGWMRADSHRFLVVRGRPVAMTGFNAVLPDIVQVGGVYVPPDLRNRGHARRAVALHLAEARAAGVRDATLFAASGAAVASYAALGFRRIGTFTLVLFDERVTP